MYIPTSTYLHYNYAQEHETQNEQTVTARIKLTVKVLRGHLCHKMDSVLALQFCEPSTSYQSMINKMPIYS
jgi:hypothetical protein